MLVPSLLFHAIDIVSHSFDIFTIYSNMTKIADPGFGILSFKSWMAIVLGDLIVYSYLCVFLLTMIRINFASVLALDSSLKRFVKIIFETSAFMSGIFVGCVFNTNLSFLPRNSIFGNFINTSIETKDIFICITLGGMFFVLNVLLFPFSVMISTGFRDKDIQLGWWLCILLFLLISQGQICGLIFLIFEFPYISTNNIVATIVNSAGWRNWSRFNW